MQKNRKFSLDELLNKIDQKKADVCRKILIDFKNEIDILPGSRIKHQDWPGGYKDHILETMNIAVILYESMASARKLNFTLADVLFILFIHDLDKLFRYAENSADNAIATHKDYHLFVKDYLQEKYGFVLSGEESNAIKYIHGENEDYHPTKKIMFPLTAFAHCCDIISARIWFGHGKDKNYW